MTRREHVTVAELLVRTTVPDGRVVGTPVVPRARHRAKPPGTRSLTRLRVLSVVAGALALTGGVGAAVSMPVQRSADVTWPPAGLEPLPVALVPLPVDVVVPPARPAPESVAPVRGSAGNSPGTAAVNPDSGISPARRGTLARAVKIIDRVNPQSRQVASVRHEVPAGPSWSRGGSAEPERRAVSAGRHHGSAHHGGGHHGSGHGHGGGRHRR